MPTPTYTALANITLSSSASSVTFSSIPATYRDLVMVSNLVYSGGTGDTVLTINGDSGSNYHSIWMLGNGSTTSSSTNSPTAYLNPIFNAASGRGVMVWQLMDYSATDKHKTSLVRTSTQSTNVVAMAGRWASTSAVTSITIRDFASDTFASGSTFALYGIAS